MPEAGSSNTEIEDNLTRASEGDGLSLQKLLLGVIAGPLYIPDRNQPRKLSYQPEYPNDFVSIMGVQDKERVVVPVFTSADLIEPWFGSELQFKQFSGTQLFSILPEDWWILINPGQELEKEISPWEISRLKEGEPGIKEVLEEIAQEDAIVQTIELKQIQESDFSELKTKLTEFASARDEILKLYMLLEKSLTTDGGSIEQILVGIECKKNVKDIEKIKDEAGQLCSINLIGNLGAKVRAGVSGNNIILGVFKDTVPFYTTKASAGGILGAITGFFKN